MLNATLLLASTINAEGCIELPAVGLQSPAATALFWPGEGGELLQRVLWAPPTGGPGAGRPLNAAFFARCVRARFGALTPAPFGADAPGSHTPEAAEVEPDRGEAAASGVWDPRAGPEGVIRDAFNVHLTAYEAGLI